MNRIYKTAIAALVLGVSASAVHADTVTFDDQYSNLITNGSINSSPAFYFLPVPLTYLPTVTSGVTTKFTTTGKDANGVSYTVDFLKYNNTSTASWNDHTSSGTSTSGVDIFTTSPNGITVTFVGASTYGGVYVPSFYVTDLGGGSGSVTITARNGTTVVGTKTVYPGLHNQFDNTIIGSWVNVTAFQTTRITSLVITGTNNPQLDDITASVTLPKLSSAWNVNGSGDFNTAANWTDSVVPNGGVYDVTFGSGITSSQTIYNNSNATVGTMTFNNSTASYFIGGTGTINILGGHTDTATPSYINVVAGNHVLTPGTLDFGVNTAINVANASSLTIGGTIGGVIVDAGKSVTVATTGTGSLNVIGTIHLGSGSHFAYVEAPSLALANVVVTDGISGEGTLDLSNNKLIIHGGSLAAVNAQIAAGNITSSLAASASHSNVTAVGALSGADYLALNGASFAGQTVVASDVVAAYTFAGDINLDGVVSASDLALITLGGSGWVEGDFNHDGTVNAVDFALADAAYKLQSGSVADALVLADSARFGSDFDAAYAAALAGGIPSEVPEPASLALLGLGAAALLRRRK